MRRGVAALGGGLGRIGGLVGVGEAGGSEREANGGGGRCIRSPRWSPSHVLEHCPISIEYSKRTAAAAGAIPRLALSKSERFVAVTSGPAVELPTATISKYPNTLSLSLSLGPLTLIARSSVAEGQTARSRAAPAGGSRDGARAGTAARASPEQHVGFARESCRRRGAWWLAGRKG